MKKMMVLVIGLLLIGCAHRTLDRQQAFVNDPSIEQKYLDAINQKRIILGMTPNMVEAVYGPPHSVNYASDKNGSQIEVWEYHPSMAKQFFFNQYGFATTYLYIAFIENKVALVFNDTHFPSVIFIPGIHR